MLSDTILSIATAPGAAGVGVLRLSGPRAVEALEPLFKPADGRPLSAQDPRYLSFGTVIDAHGQALDQAMAVRFEAPHSFTGEAVVELHVHGGSFHLKELQALILASGKDLLPPLRLARPGEFTQRAFLNGKLDLTQAEAVADLIHSGSVVSRDAAARQLNGGLQVVVDRLREGVLGLLAEAEAACDFPEEASQLSGSSNALRKAQALLASMRSLIEGARTGRMVVQGVKVALAGAPNAGKSSLLNALAGEERAIVSPEPGTTRDYLELRYQIEGFPVLFYDTAGLRQPKGAIEAEGVRRTRRLAAECDLLLLILDQSAPFDPAVLSEVGAAQVDTLFVLNKNDLEPAWDVTALRTALKNLRPDWASAEVLRQRVLSVSAKRASGLDHLRARILDTALEGRAADMLDRVVLTQARHEEAMLRAAAALEHAARSLSQDASPEMVAVDLRASLDALGEIVGVTARSEVLEAIFSRFCIGK